MEPYALCASASLWFAFWFLPIPKKISNSSPRIDNPFFLTTMRLLPDQTTADSFSGHSYSPKPVVGIAKLNRGLSSL